MGFRWHSILVVVASCLVAGGCSMRSGLDHWSVPEPAATTPEPEWDGAPEEWKALNRLKRGTRVAVYRKDGRVSRESIRYATPQEILLESHSVPREDVLAVARVPKDSAWDGTAIGLGIGAALGLATGVAADATEDVDPLPMTIWGALWGAGPGALLDAGIAKKEEMVYRREPETLSVPDDWTFTVTPNNVARWVTGRKIDLMLADATYFSGKVVQGDGDEIEVEVKDSSREDKKGTRTRIRTGAISTINFTENRGGNLAVAAVGGALAGLLMGGTWGSLAEFPNEGIGTVMAGGLGAVVGASVGGGLAYHNKRREVTLVVQAPAR